jgi:hypothetical protein
VNYNSTPPVAAGSLFTKNEDYAKMFQNIVQAKLQSEVKASFEILYDTVIGALRNVVDQNSNAFAEQI